MTSFSRFSNQVAIITGGADGLGKGVALRMAKEGASLAIVDRNQKLLETTVAEITSSGTPAIGYNADISEEDQVAKTFQRIVKDYKKVDVLVHAAGIIGPTSTPITDYPTEEFDTIYRINLKGSFLVTKYVLPYMTKNNYGRILLISSIAGKEGNPGMVGYSTMKAGMTGLIKGVAKEYAKSGITVNGLAPAVIRTAMNKDTSAEQLSYMLAKIPMGRLGEVEEVAAMVSFIVSRENSFSTGFIYDISGGRATY